MTGAATYIPAKPCRRGHSMRYTAGGICVECAKAGAKRRLQRRPDAVRAYQRAWRAANRERIHEYRVAYHAEHRDRLIQKTLDWQKANPQRANEKAARWAKENPKQRQVYAHNRRARLHQCEGTHTAEDVAQIFKAQRGKCAACKKRRKLTVDHITPIIRGGANSRRNLQGLCRPCNSSKGGRDPITFMQSRGGRLI